MLAGTLKGESGSAPNIGYGSHAIDSEVGAVQCAAMRFAPHTYVWDFEEYNFYFRWTDAPDF